MLYYVCEEHLKQSLKPTLDNVFYIYSARPKKLFNITFRFVSGFLRQRSIVDKYSMGYTRLGDREGTSNSISIPLDVPELYMYVF